MKHTGKIIGQGLDKDQDGIHHLTKTKNMILRGGSKKTHEHMQEVAIRFEEGVKGRNIHEMHSDEVREKLYKAIEKTGRM